MSCIPLRLIDNQYNDTGYLKKVQQMPLISSSISAMITYLQKLLLSLLQLVQNCS